MAETELLLILRQIENARHFMRYKCGEAIRTARYQKSLCNKVKFAFTCSIGLYGKVRLFSTAQCEIKNVDIKPVKPPQFDWAKLFCILYNDIWKLLGAVVAALIVALLNIQIPVCLGDMVNVISQLLYSEANQNFLEQMKKPAIHLIGIYILQAAATFVYISLLSVVGENVALQLRFDLFKAFLEQDMAFYDKSRTGELVDCLATDVQEFKSSFKHVVSQGLRSLTQIIGCLTSLIIISPTMTGIMVMVVPTVIGIGTFLGSILRKVSHKAQLQALEAITQSEEILSNMRTVRAFANEDKECENFRKKIEKATNLNIKLGIGIGLFQAGTNLFLNSLVLGTLYVGGKLMYIQNLTPGSLMSFLVATQTIQRSLGQLSLLLGQFIKGKEAGARVFEFINLKPIIAIRGGKTISYHSLVPIVEFKNVTFSYPTRPASVVLDRLNLTMPPGKTVAVVGASGNGKSTIANLLERFYDVDEGIISINGINIKDLDPSWLRKNVIGIINQEPTLFATTIMENIRYGKEATDDEVYAAAKLANADDFIKSFPDGYNTILGERGVTVSGGQKQRIAIARAVLKNPSILILDEATSALDPESEKTVQKTLEAASKGRTVLIIAHRLTTVENADVILVLQNGKVIEEGNHETLISKRGVYYNLMNKQLNEEQSKNRSQA